MLYSVSDSFSVHIHTAVKPSLFLYRFSLLSISDLIPLRLGFADMGLSQHSVAVLSRESPIPGVLAVLQCRSHGVPDKVAKIIRIKVLVNGLFSCQNTSERADLFVARN